MAVPPSIWLEHEAAPRRASRPGRHTQVNAPHGKNLVGSYYAPIRIVVDPDVLQTLDDWLLPDGMGEIVKHALCQDAELLRMLDDFDGPLTDPDFLEAVVRRTIELKCQVIDIDPKEKREAVVLVYGHTLGHPIEAISHRFLGGVFMKVPSARLEGRSSVFSSSNLGADALTAVASARARDSRPLAPRSILASRPLSSFHLERSHATQARLALLPLARPGRGHRLRRGGARGREDGPLRAWCD